MAQSDPASSQVDNPLQPINILLRFFLAACLFFGIAGVQVVYDHMSSVAGGTKINQFVDLCTLANVSLILLDEHLHGYYLHGQAPWHSSDIPLDWLQHALHEEAGGGGLPPRGLRNNTEPSDGGFCSSAPEDRVQTFQIYIPLKLREELLRTRESMNVDVVDT